MGAEVTLEGFLITTAKGLGVAAYGFVFAWLFMKQYFKQVDKNVGNVTLFTELTAKVSALQKSMEEGLALVAKIYSHLDAEVTELHSLYGDQQTFRATSLEVYRHIESELIRQGTAINEIVKVLDISNFVTIATRRGYMTTDQSRIVVEEAMECKPDRRRKKAED